MQLGGRLLRRCFRSGLGRSVDRPLVFGILGSSTRCGTDKIREHEAVIILRSRYGADKHDDKSDHQQYQDDYERALFAGMLYPLSFFQKCRIRTLHQISEQSRDSAVFGDIDIHSRRMLGKSGHCYDRTCEDYEITCACGQIAVSDGEGEAFGIA